ncbi:histidine phosphatase family protein [Alkalibacillus sp. S2W]|uniref:histidine phosphatase family protein n=1 Tax=Alkalibacillus sp. S2W TaxID=3386553 RepID=UPI00398CE8F5
MSFNLVLIRHEESEADIPPVRHEGQADNPLTNRGRKQIKKLSEFTTSNYSFDRIYSSTLKRAKESAKIINQDMNSEIVFLDELMEMSNGVLAGMTKEEAKIKYPLPMDRRPHESVEEGESLIDFKYRIENILSRIKAEAEREELAQICIVGYGGTISIMIQLLLQIPSFKHGFMSGDAGISDLTIHSDKVMINFLNR